MDDSTAIMGIVVLIFVIPAKPRFWFFRPALGRLELFLFTKIKYVQFFIDLSSERGPEIPSPALLDWKYAQDRIPWGLFLLMGTVVLDKNHLN